jgi:hypothetical protein
VRRLELPEDRRFLIRAELDAAFFHLYLPADANGDWIPARKADGCPYDETPEQLAELKKSFPKPRDAVDYIMDTFPIVKRKDEEKWRSYRTKEMILSIYDEMQEAVRTGKEYQTKLEPPPGDKRCCHLAPGAKRPVGETYQLNDLLTVDLSGETVPVFVAEESGLAGPRQFRFLSANDPLPDKNHLVIIRHPDLEVGDRPASIAVGKLQWIRQQDAKTGAPFVLVTLRGYGPTAQLRVPDDDWESFRPLAVLQA